MKKRIIGIMLSCMMLFQMGVPAMAEETAVLSAESITIENGSQIQEYLTEDNKMHTIYWTRGIEAPVMSGTKGPQGLYGDFRKTVDAPGTQFESEIYSMGYETGKGYYDLNKENPDTDHRCYLAAMQNMLYWWMDQNSDYINRYLEGLESGRFVQSENLANPTKEQWAQIRKAPDPVYSDRTGMVGQYLDNSYLVRNHYMEYNRRNTGYYMDKVGDFFINGYLPVSGDDPNRIEDYQQSKDGGFFFPVFGKNQIDQRHATSKYSFYNENMKDWILEGKGVTIAHRVFDGAHAISVWGAEYDENGNLCRVYVTDSNDIYDEIFSGNMSRGIYGYDVYDKDGLAYVGTYTNKEARPGTMLMQAAVLDLAQDQWEQILADTETEPGAPVIKAQPKGRSYGKNAVADSLTVTAENAKEEQEKNAFLSYQWFKADNREYNGIPIEGATESSYVPELSDTPVTDYYYCEVTNNKYGKKNTIQTDFAEIVTTEEETFHAKAPKIIKDLTSPAEYIQGQQDNPLKIEAQSVDNGVITYQWYSSPDANPNNGTKINGATSAEFMPPTNVCGDRFYYFCKVTNTNENATGTRTNTVNSQMVRVKVQEALIQEPLKILDVPSEVYYKDEFVLRVEGGSGATSVLSWEITEGNAYASVDSETGKITVTGAGEFTVTATNKATKYSPVSDSVTITAKKLTPSVNDVRTEGTFCDNASKEEIESSLTWKSDVEGKMILDGDVLTLKPGENELSWTFQPEDSGNYQEVKGKLTINCLKYVEPEPEPETKPDPIETGWVKRGKTWFYYNQDGVMQTGWHWIDGQCYYFYGSGEMAADTVIDGCYVNGSGAWVQDRWILDDSGWWYAYAQGGYAVGWKLISGKWYYFDGNGYMQTGWHWINGQCYYFYGSGEMAADTVIDGYYVDGSGAWVQGRWILDGSGWWYAYTQGGYAVGWKLISGKWYYFDGNGYMQIGWHWIDGQCYYFYGSGEMAADTVVDGYYVNESGAWVY